jgi:diacylglycerol kinase family enzyme
MSKQRGNQYQALNVGGDGTTAEVFNGLMSRPHAAAAVAFPLGIIPAGSGNAQVGQCRFNRRNLC